MLRKTARIIIVILATIPAAFPFQKAAPAAGKSTKSQPALTDEEKELLKHRELLENLELLQNFEKIKYLNFLAAKKPDVSKVKQADKAPVKDDEQKKINP
jgi:hypothetical protein